MPLDDTEAQDDAAPPDAPKMPVPGEFRAPPPDDPSLPALPPDIGVKRRLGSSTPGATVKGFALPDPKEWPAPSPESPTADPGARMAPIQMTPQQSMVMGLLSKLLSPQGSLALKAAQYALQPTATAHDTLPRMPAPRGRVGGPDDQKVYTRETTGGPEETATETKPGRQGGPDDAASYSADPNIKANTPSMKGMTFNAAFQAARRSGLHTFKWNGKFYSTRRADESHDAWAQKFAPALAARAGSPDTSADSLNAVQLIKDRLLNGTAG